MTQLGLRPLWGLQLAFVWGLLFPLCSPPFVGLNFGDCTLGCGSFGNYLGCGFCGASEVVIGGSLRPHSVLFQLPLVAVWQPERETGLV